MIQSYFVLSSLGKILYSRYYDQNAIVHQKIDGLLSKLNIYDRANCNGLIEHIKLETIHVYLEVQSSLILVIIINSENLSEANFNFINLVLRQFRVECSLIKKNIKHLHQLFQDFQLFVEKLIENHPKIVFQHTY